MHESVPHIKQNIMAQSTKYGTLRGLRHCPNCDAPLEYDYCIVCGHEVEVEEDIDPRRKREEEIGDVKHDLDR